MRTWRLSSFFNFYREKSNLTQIETYLEEIIVKRNLIMFINPRSLFIDMITSLIQAKQ